MRFFLSSRYGRAMRVVYTAISLPRLLRVSLHSALSSISLESSSCRRVRRTVNTQSSFWVENTCGSYF